MFRINNVLRGLPNHLKIQHICSGQVRNYTDKSPKSDSKRIMVKVGSSNRRSVDRGVKVQGTESEQHLRVRLTRPSDVPRVIRFVRDQVSVWPGAIAPHSSSLVVTDYVTRTLAQGHSLLAEQFHTGKCEVRGLALTAAVCPWDADILEKWARCVHCMRSRRFLFFAAHCLRAPALHEKYKVDKILQVNLIVPPGISNNSDIMQILTKKVIKHGKDAGFQLMRFDVTKDSVAKSLEEHNLEKEWFLSYMLSNNPYQDLQRSNYNFKRNNTQYDTNYVAVYSKTLNYETL